MRKSQSFPPSPPLPNRTQQWNNVRPFLSLVFFFFPKLSSHHFFPFSAVPKQRSPFKVTLSFSLAPLLQAHLSLSPSLKVPDSQFSSLPKVWFQNKRSKERRMKQMSGRGKFFLHGHHHGAKLRKFGLDERFYFYDGRPDFGPYGPPPPPPPPGPPGPPYGPPPNQQPGDFYPPPPPLPPGAFPGLTGKTRFLPLE